MPIRTRLKPGNTFLFFIFWIAVILVYAPAYKAGFVAEFINYLQSFEHNTFLEFINRHDTYVKSFYQVPMLFRYLYISTFGTHPIPWFLVFTLLHALCGLLVFNFFSSLFKDFKLRNGLLIAFAGTLLFLFNPNITEITVWKACDHYYLSVLMQLSVLIFVRKYLTSHHRKYAWFAGIVFACSTYALEIFYATPLLTLFLILGYSWKNIVDKSISKKALLALFLPQLVLFILHLISFRIVYGSWIAHYGTTNEFIWSAQDILKGYGKYIGYMGLMAGHYPWTLREPIYRFLSQPVVYYFIVGLITLFIAIGLVRFKRLSSQTQLLVFLTGAFICSITLCLTTYFDDLFSLYNSRRCYQPGIFFYMALSLLVFSIKKKWLSYTVFTLYLCTCFALTFHMVFRWRHAAKIQHGVLRTFRWQEKPTVVLLNLPTYFVDVRIIPANKENEFADQLRFFRYPPMKGMLYSVCGYNMKDEWDGAHVTVIDSVSLKVTLNQWGSWWMYNYNGATDYENDLYQIKMTDPGHEYRISFKHVVDTNTAVLYQQGEQWRVVNWNRKDEQW